jgi:hypothetical protein
MASTIQNQVGALLRRRVAESKFGGAPRSPVEAAALFDSIALIMLLHPRSVIYFMLLARNGLIQNVQGELAAIRDIRSAIADLSNASSQILGEAVLAKARDALLSLESLPRLSGSNLALERYTKSVDEFLNVHLAPNVRRIGGTELTRPSAEALAGMPSYLADLADVHDAMLSRLYSLAVGVENFEASPFSALLGTTVVGRIRRDVEAILSQVQAYGDPAQARDFATRLIANTATLNTLASPPSWKDAILTDVEAFTVPAASVAVSTIADGAYGAVAGELAVTIDITNFEPLSFSLFPVAPCLLSTPSELTYPHNARLYIRVDGQTVAIPIGLGGIPSDPPSEQSPGVGTYQSVAALAAAITANGASRIQAAALGEQVVVYSTGATAISVVEPTDFVSVNAAPAVGLLAGQSATLGHIGAEDVVVALNILFGEIIFADTTVDSSGKTVVRVSSLYPDLDSKMTISGATGYGLNGTYSGTTDVLYLTPTEFLQPWDPVAATSESSTEKLSSFIKTVTESYSVTLTSGLPSFYGTASVSSALVERYMAFIAELDAFLGVWKDSDYAADLSKLDRAVAALVTSQAPAQRNMVLTELNTLEADLTKLLNVLTNTSTMLPDGAARVERGLVEAILATLWERGFERAADLLMLGDIASMLEMNSDKASYGGTVLDAASGIAPQFDTDTTRQSGRPDSVMAGG